MIDLETVSTKHNAVILTAAAVKFDVYSDKVFDGLYLRPDIEEQTAQGRDIDNGTLEWWSKQEDNVKNEAFGDEDRISLPDFLNQIHKFCWNVDRIWAKGPLFDIIILENIFRANNMNMPWSYSKIRDARTVYDMDPESISLIKDAHNAFMDCLNQITVVQAVYKKLGVKNAFDK